MSDQVEANYAAYVAKYQNEMERNHPGKIALMHDEEIVMVLNDFGDAYTVGEKDYGLGNFSIVEIGKRPTRLSRRAIGAIPS